MALSTLIIAYLIVGTIIMADDIHSIGDLHLPVVWPWVLAKRRQKRAPKDHRLDPPPHASIGEPAKRPFWRRRAHGKPQAADDSLDTRARTTKKVANTARKLRPKW